MENKQRHIKRIAILFVYLVIFTLPAYSIYYLFIREASTCSDGIQNQREEKIDCGGPCEPCPDFPNIADLIIEEKDFVAVGENYYDAVAKITNPNSIYGIANFAYTFDLVDRQGKVTGRAEGEGFLLPNQTKYVMAFKIPSNEKPAGLEIRIKSFEWEKFDHYEEPNIEVYGKEFNLAAGAGFASMKLKIRNATNYDFRRIQAGVVVRSKTGGILAVSQSGANDVRNGEERELSFTWNFPFDSTNMSERIEVIAETNVFDNENYMRNYGDPSQYKNYGI